MGRDADGDSRIRGKIASPRTSFDNAAVRRTARRGYDGAHDSVHRFVKAWRADRARTPTQAFIPLRFDPGEAYQFDWSHEGIELHSLPLTIKLAQMRLSYSRMPIFRAYFRETQEMVF